jgi:hypothetical protein
VKNTNTFRNKIAHSGTRIHGAELWLVTNATTMKRGNPKGEHITNSMVQAELDSIRDAMTVLDDVIDWEKLTSNKGLMRAFRCTTGSTNHDQEQC